MHQNNIIGKKKYEYDGKTVRYLKKYKTVCNMILNAICPQAVFDTFQLMFYNITFTSLPILIYGFNEKDIPEDTLIKNPKIYR